MRVYDVKYEDGVGLLRICRFCGAVLEDERNNPGPHESRCRFYGVYEDIPDIPENDDVLFRVV